MEATLTSKGQLTLPKSLRDDLGLKSGDSVSFEKTGDGTYELRRKEKPSLDDIIGAFAPFMKHPPLSDEECEAGIGQMLADDDDRIRREARR